MEKPRPTFFDRISEKWGYVVSTGYDTSQIPVRKRPQSDQIFYTDSFLCLCGRTGTVPDPKRQGKRKYFWSGVTLLSVLFLGIMAVMGTSTRLDCSRYLP